MKKVSQFPITDFSVGTWIPNSELQAVLAKQHITKLHGIQIEAIQRGLFYHQNFLVSTPSGSGKTLIAEMAVYNTLLKGMGKSLYLVPFKALASEKYEEFIRTLDRYGLKIIVATSDEDSDVLPTDFDLLITTYEKCDSIVRSNPNFNFKCIVIDEIHEMGSPIRGARLEVLLLKVVTISQFAQIIALSATIKNYEQFCNWLSSLTRKFQLIHGDIRPVPLSYDIQETMVPINTIKMHIQRVVKENGQVLVFVPRRKDCVTYCEQLEAMVKTLLSEKELGFLERRFKVFPHKQMHEFLKAGICYHNASLSKEIRKDVEKGFRERLIKVLVATSTLAAGVNTPARCVIVSSIIQSRDFNSPNPDKYFDSQYARINFQLVQPISPNLMFQMLGRAGRFGHDSIGEGIILVRNREEHNYARTHYFDEFVVDRLIPKYNDLESQLHRPLSLQEYILTLIQRLNGANLIQLTTELRKTYWYHTQSHLHDERYLLEALGIVAPSLDAFLYLYTQNVPQGKLNLYSVSYSKIEGTIGIGDRNFLCALNPAGFYCACHSPNNKIKQTETGFVYTHICDHLAAFIAQLSIQSREIQECTLNLLQLITNRDYAIDFLQREKLIGYNHLTEKYSITAMGVLSLQLYLFPDEFAEIRNMVQNYAFSTDEVILQKVAQLYTRHLSHSESAIFELILLWIEEHTIEDILKSHPKWGSADVHNIKSQIARYMGTFEVIAHHFNKIDLEQRFNRLKLRITHGIKAELIDLLESFQPHISRNRARILFNSGFQTSNSLENVSLAEIYRATKISVRVLSKLLKREKEMPQNPPNSLDGYID